MIPPNDPQQALAVCEIERLTLATTPPVEIDGKAYSRVPLFDPRRKQDVPEAFQLSTLDSLIDYVKRELDAGTLRSGRGTFAHVVSPVQVLLLSEAFGPFLQRVAYVDVRARLPGGFIEGEWLDPESAIILLQTHFAGLYDRDLVQRIVGNLASEKVVAASDDGVSQAVTVRAGVTRVGRVEVANPVTLAPYRTFLEVEQPGSPFVLRLRGGGDGALPTVALFEADGGAWQQTAVQTIGELLRTELGPAIPVLC